ncbi:response regulator [Pararhodobacter sp.]|uniref:response regulator n=1 Tax=Pararhodobacter sp. TaxID=2127056 RepID=UPI002FE3B2C5|nr:response regulator [Pseudomonadota bacterium]
MPNAPYAADQPRPLPDRAAVVAFAMPPRTLLLVEDSRLAAEAVRLICRRAGIRLRRAESLASATLHLRVYRPDIVLVDLGLPDGSGLDLIAALAPSTLRPQRLVAISGDAGLEGAAMAAGADAFLAKPVSIARHLAVLIGEPVGDGLPDWPVRLDAMRDRGAGGDPMALRDDLRRATDLLNGRGDSSQHRYAAQFLASVGQTLRDPSLTDLAERAARMGDYGSLAALVRARAAVIPTI